MMTTFRRRFLSTVRISVVRSLTLDFFSKADLQKLGWADQQRVFLVNSLIALSLTIGVFYFCKSIILGKPVEEINIALVILALSLTSGILVFKGFWFLGKIVIAFTANGVVFYLSLSHPIEDGSYMLYIPNSIAAFLIFSDRQKYASLLFSVIPVGLFLSSLVIRGYSLIKGHADFFLHFGAAIVCVILQMIFLVAFHRKAERKSAENELQLKDSIAKLQRLSRDMDNLVYSSSHDLRSPIVSIQGLVHLLRRGPEKEELLHCIDRIEHSVLKMDRIVSDIKYYADNKNFSPVFKSIDIRTLSEEIAAELVALNPEPFTFINQIIPFQIFSDEERLKVGIRNVLMNAIQYRDTAKKDHQVIMSSVVEKNRLTLTIADSGIGIPGDHLKHVYKMFYRGTVLSRGSGMGLFLARESLRKIGWQIQIESAPGKGTIVRLSSSLINLSSTL